MLVEFLAICALALCVFAAVKDITALTIPNWLNLGLAVGGSFALLIAGLEAQMVLAHLGLGAAAFLVAILLFCAGVFGGGDAKMIPAVLIWLGPGALLPFLLWMAIAGGVLAMLLLAMRPMVPAGMQAGRRLPKSLRAGEGVPYGVAITIGLFAAAPQSVLFAPLLQQLGLLH